MAEFLVFAENRISLALSPESSTSLPKRGDITAVRPDGFAWGREESKAVWVAEGRDPNMWPGKTTLVKVPGMASDKLEEKLVRTVVRPAVPGEEAFNVSDAEDRFVTQHQYAWRMNLSSLPSKVRSRLRRDREITMTRKQLRYCCDHKVTRVRFDERDLDGYGRSRTLKERNMEMP